MEIRPNPSDMSRQKQKSPWPKDWGTFGQINGLLARASLDFSAAIARPMEQISLAILALPTGALTLMSVAPMDACRVGDEQ